MVGLHKDNDTVAWGENGCQEPAADYWARNIRLKARIKGNMFLLGVFVHPLLLRTTLSFFQ